MKFTLASLSLLMLTILVLMADCKALGPLVKVCGTRELKEVTESVCSTMGKRDTIPFYASSILGQRIKRECLIWCHEVKAKSLWSHFHPDRNVCRRDGREMLSGGMYTGILHIVLWLIHEHADLKLMKHISCNLFLPFPAFVQVFFYESVFVLSTSVWESEPQLLAWAHGSLVMQCFV